MPSVCPIPTPVPAVSQGDKYMSRFSSFARVGLAEPSMRVDQYATTALTL
jgi:hypothetical protein